MVCLTRTKALFPPVAGLIQGLGSPSCRTFRPLRAVWLQHSQKQPGCTVQPLEQRRVRQHLSNTDTSRLVQHKLNALAYTGGVACAQNTFSFHFLSSSHHKSPTPGLHESSLVLGGRGIIPNSAHSLQSLPLHYFTPFLWAGLTVLGISPPQMYLSGIFTKTIPTLFLFLLSLLFSGTQPWLRILTYFLHTQIHGRSPLSPAATKSPLKTSSVLPAGLGPLTHHIPGAYLKTPRDLHTDTNTGETKNSQASGHSRPQSARFSNMSAVIYLNFPASPTGKNNLTNVDKIC